MHEWFFLDPFAQVDPTSIQIVLSLARSVPALVVARLGLDATMPSPLRKLAWEEVLVPALRSEDGIDLARAMLGEAEEEIAKRVAVLGGDTHLGVEEAARLLVSAGDLLWDGQTFVWRAGPRAGVAAIPIEELLFERVEALETPLRKMLEAVCVLPAGAPLSVIAAIATLDGLEDREQSHALQHLQAEAFLIETTFVEPSSELLRRAIVRTMPPARRSELHRFVAKVLKDSPHYQGALTQATFGYFAAQGGEMKEGAAALIRAAEAAQEATLALEVRRLAASAVQLCPEEEIRRAAAALVRVEPTEDEGSHPQATRSAAAVRALLRGDLEEVERTIESAIAQGGDIGAANRLRTMALLARGDAERARATWRRSSADEVDGPRAAREALTSAWLLLHSGDPEAGIKEALFALAHVRRSGDTRGEIAALHTLAACFRILEREGDARAISQRAAQLSA